MGMDYSIHRISEHRKALLSYDVQIKKDWIKIGKPRCNLIEPE